MAVSFVQEKLKEWSLLDLIEAFVDQGIDDKALLCIDPEVAEDLIPKTRPRLKFLNKLRRYKSEIGTDLELFRTTLHDTREPHILLLSEKLNPTQIFFFLEPTAIECKTLFVKCVYILDVHSPDHAKTIGPLCSMWFMIWSHTP